MKCSEQYRVTVNDIAFGGDGVARTDEGAVIFIPGACPEDELLVTITETRKNFARGEIAAILKPGRGRCAPQCRLYGRCAGCQYQHMDYAVEQEVKRQQLRTLLTRIGGFTQLPETAPAVASPQHYGYRNKLRLEPAFMELPGVEGKRLVYGYYGPDNRSLLRVTSCPLAREDLNSAIPEAARSDWGKANARKRGRDGRPGALTMRITTGGEVAYYFGYAPRRVSWLKEQLAGREYSVPLGSFWQVNPPVASELIRTVAVWLAERPAETFIDAYAGVGTFTCAMQNPFRERLLIENDREAAKAAQFNVVGRCGLGCQIIADTTEKALPGLLRKCTPEATAVLLDPPRSGCCREVMEALRLHHPGTVVYVSCNPSTLARDLRALCADGSYRMAHLGFFDMFPRTAHFESAVMLTGR